MKKIVRIPLYIILTALLFWSYKYHIGENFIINSDIGDVIMIFVPVALLTGFFIWSINNDLTKLATKELARKWLAILVLSLLWDKTFNRYILPFESGFSGHNLLDSGLLIIQSYAIVTVIAEILSKLSIKASPHASHWYSIIIFALPALAISVFTWLCVYPAVMSVDSVYVWSMVQGVVPYHDIHPLPYIALLELLSHLWNSPACIVLFQILLTAFAIGFSGWTLERLGLPRVYCWLSVIVMSILPETWIYSVTIFKDTIYTMALLVFIDVLVLAIHDPDGVLPYTKWYVFAGLSGLLAVLMRHNGILTVGGTLALAVLVLILMKKRSWMLKACCTLGAIIILFCGTSVLIKASLGGNLKEQPYSPLIYTHPMHQIVCIYGQCKDELDEETLLQIDKYLNLEFIDRYLFGDKAYGYGQGYYFEDLQQSGDWEQINGDKRGYWDLWLCLVRMYPNVAELASQKLSSIIWYSGDYGFTTTYAFGIYDGSFYGLVNIPEDPKLPQGQVLISSFLKQIDKFPIIWRPAWALVLSLIFALTAVKRKGAKSMFILLPMFLNSMGLLMAAPYPDTRFVYINFYSLVIFGMYTLLENKAEKSPEN